MHRIGTTLAAAMALAACTRLLPATTSTPWWHHAVIYEVYPRSFQDTNGDGIGDIPGITARLDYLQQLGVDAVWVAPVYPSPQVDFGYDISDDEAIDPMYGTLADFDRLVAAARQRHIGIVMDMVLNHTSDRHRWFIQSASSRTNPRADWYVWNDGIAATGQLSSAQLHNIHTGPHGRVAPPNNWVSVFGGSAWEWVPARQQYYYHDFYRQQPDLNWRNPAVRAAMYATIRFWLDRGVAGLRLDAIDALLEDPALRNEPALGGTNAMGDQVLDHIHTEYLPELHDILRDMRRIADSYPGDRVLIGETYLKSTAAMAPWYGGAARDELQLPMDTLPGFAPGATLSPAWFRPLLDQATRLPGTPLLVFDNHDRHRAIDRFGDGNPAHAVPIAKALAAILYTTPGAALTYYGAEIGMVTSTPTRRADVVDPIGITGWPTERGRDGERTPMQWTPGPEAGFTTSPHPWLPIPASHAITNVQTEGADPASLLAWTTRLIALRRTDAALHDGTLRLIGTNDPAVLAFLRRAPDGRQVLVAINLSPTPQTRSFAIPGAAVAPAATTLAASDPTLDDVHTTAAVVLPPYASWIAALQ